MLDVVEFMERGLQSRWGDERRVVRLPRDYDIASILQTWPAAPLPRPPCRRVPGVPPTRTGQGPNAGLR